MLPARYDDEYNGIENETKIKSASFQTLVWFLLVSLLNGISTFVGHLISKLSLEGNSSGTI